MGMTPLAGIMMGTRCGDIDPAISLLNGKRNLTASEVDTRMNKKSGFLGIYGRVLTLESQKMCVKSGDNEAILAYEMFCYRGNKKLYWIIYSCIRWNRCNCILLEELEKMLL